MPFINKIRLPFYLTRPQFPVEENIYQRTDGTRRVTRAEVYKELEGVTDYMPEQVHGRLQIAFRHETVAVRNPRFDIYARINGGYQIEWIEFMDFPVAPAKFKMYDEGFAAKNSTCAVCSDVDQLELVNDQFPAPLGSGIDVQINVATNDSICCSDPVFDIESFDLTVLDGVAIDQNGLAILSIKQGINGTGNIELFSYSVTCNGVTKSASVFGSIAGGTGGGSVACPVPAGLTATFDPNDPMPFAVLFAWSNAVQPADGWKWSLVRLDTYGNEIPMSNGQGFGNSLSINGLAELTTFRFYLTSVCGDQDESAPIFIQVQTPAINPQNPTAPPVSVLVEVIEIELTDTAAKLGIRATIIGGQTFDEPITINGDFEVFGTVYQLASFGVTIVPGDTTNQTGILATTGLPYSTSFGTVIGTPATLTEQGTGDPYQLALLY